MHHVVKSGLLLKFLVFCLQPAPSFDARRAGARHIITNAPSSSSTACAVSCVYLCLVLACHPLVEIWGRVKPAAMGASCCKAQRTDATKDDDLDANATNFVKPKWKSSEPLTEEKLKVRRGRAVDASWRLGATERAPSTLLWRPDCIGTCGCYTLAVHNCYALPFCRRCGRSSGIRSRTTVAQEVRTSRRGTGQLRARIAILYQ